MAAKQRRPYRPPMEKRPLDAKRKNPVFHPWYRAATYVVLMVIGVGLVALSNVDRSTADWALGIAWVPLVAAIGLGRYWQSKDS